ncbi:MAG: alpha/beta fold hydrolase [Gemmatimonadota bacterium]|nr:alpha/beta fold hydrolase [Gemmatimonadota bacterium]
MISLRMSWLLAAPLAVVLACASPPPATVSAAPAASSAAAPSSLTLAGAADEYFMSGDVRIRFRDIGQGASVVLIHGLARSLEDWFGLGDSLARDHHVIAFDVRGFGKSTRLKDPSRLGIEMAEDVIRLLDHLGIARAHLVGHSMGAAIAAKLAATHPDRVLSVSLLAGPFFGDSTAFARDERGFAAGVERTGSMMAVIEWLFPMYPDSVQAAMNAQTMSTNDPAIIAAAMRSMDALVVAPNVASVVRAPAVVAVGGADPMLPQSRWLASWWPSSRLVEVAEADHVTILFQPETLAAIRVVTR